MALYRIGNRSGTEAIVDTLGARLVCFRMRIDQQYRSLTVESKDPTIIGSTYLGHTIGPLANRLQNGAFGDSICRLTANEGTNALHSANQGIHLRDWDVSDFDTYRLKLVCEINSGDHLYPGHLRLSTTYSLSADNVLSVDLQGTCVKDSWISLTHHSYFNLNADTDNGRQWLQIATDRYLPLDADGLPISTPQSVEHTPFDFRTPARLADRVRANLHDEQIRRRGGIDHYWCWSANDSRASATLWSDDRRIRLNVTSNQPGLQVYDGHALPCGLTGICLEPHGFPDAPNNPAFPSVAINAGETYRNQIEYAVRHTP